MTIEDDQDRKNLSSVGCVSKRKIAIAETSLEFISCQDEAIDIRHLLIVLYCQFQSRRSKACKWCITMTHDSHIKHFGFSDHKAYSEVN